MFVIIKTLEIPFLTGKPVKLFYQASVKNEEGVEVPVFSNRFEDAKAMEFDAANKMAEKWDAKVEPIIHFGLN